MLGLIAQLNQGSTANVMKQLDIMMQPLKLPDGVNSFCPRISKYTLYADKLTHYREVDALITEGDDLNQLKQLSETIIKMNPTEKHLWCWIFETNSGETVADYRDKKWKTK